MPIYDCIRVCMCITFLRLFGSNAVADILIEREERVEGRGAVDSTARKCKLLLPDIPMCILEALKPPPAVHTNYHNQEPALAPGLTYALDTCKDSIAFWRWSEKTSSKTGAAFACSDSIPVKYIKHCLTIAVSSSKALLYHIIWIYYNCCSYNNIKN